MPQISRKPLSKNKLDKIFEIFFKSFASLKNPSDIQKLLSDLLGPVERTMLAKRLAIALLLHKGYSYEAIKGTLHVSQETIARVNISLNYGGNGYQLVIKKILREEKLNEIFEKVEDATIAALPISSVKKALVAERKKTRKTKTSLG